MQHIRNQCKTKFLKSIISFVEKYNSKYRMYIILMIRLENILNKNEYYEDISTCAFLLITYM